jgi:hypothetical protein
MAKKKSKATKSMLPKRVGGLKVPKALRKGRAGRFLTSPAGIAVIGEALMAAGAVRAARKADPDSGLGRLRNDPKDEMRRIMDDVRLRGGASGEALQGAFSAATAAFAEALRKSAEALESGAKKSTAPEEGRAAH